MNTLIIYTSKYGCTKMCAEGIAERLNGNVHLQDLNKSKSIDFSPYDTVIIGGSIYAGRISKSIRELCEKNITVLEEKRLGLFICCMRQGEEAIAQLKEAFPHQLLEKAVAKDYLGGEFRFNRMNFLEKFIIKKISKADAALPELSDKENITTVDQERIEGFVKLING